MTRKNAAEQGLTRYSTGRPCLRGHICERFVSTGVCVQCAAGYNKRYNQSYLTVQAWHRRAGLNVVEVEVHNDDLPLVKALVDTLAKDRLRAHQKANVDTDAIRREIFSALRDK